MLCTTLSFLKIHQNKENTTTNTIIFDLFPPLTYIACTAKKHFLRTFQRRQHSNNLRHNWRKTNFYVHITNINEETLYLGNLKWVEGKEITGVSSDKKR